MFAGEMDRMLTLLRNALPGREATAQRMDGLADDVIDNSMIGAALEMTHRRLKTEMLLQHAKGRSMEHRVVIADERDLKITLRRLPA